MLPGLDGTSPLGFLASLGLLRLAGRCDREPRLSFLDDGTFRAAIDLRQPEAVEADGTDETRCRLCLAGMVAADAAAASGPQGWWLEYNKSEKKGDRTVADLKAPPKDFATYLRAAVDRWCAGDVEPALCAAAFGTNVAVDGKGNTKPTALHFTAANQQFLGTLEATREAVTKEWVQESLFKGHSSRRGPNLRWDPAAERTYALMANDPNDEGTRVDAPLEWLAFRGLAFMPCVPRGTRVLTTAVDGRGDEMRMTWPLWSLPSRAATVRSLLASHATSLGSNARGRGVFATCSSAIRRSAQGFGNFGPAAVSN